MEIKAAASLCLPAACRARDAAAKLEKHPKIFPAHLGTWWAVASTGWWHRAPCWCLQPSWGDEWHSPHRRGQSRGIPCLLESRVMDPSCSRPPAPCRLPLIPMQPHPSWSSDFAVTDPSPGIIGVHLPSRATSKGEGEVKAAQLIALSSRILLMNQPPQKTPDTSDFMKHSRWEDLERSHPFIELNTLEESSPRLNSNETTHHAERRQIQSHSKDAGLGGLGWLGLRAGSQLAPGGSLTLQSPLPVPACRHRFSPSAAVPQQSPVVGSRGA